MDIQIINKSHHPLPAYMTQGASGMDIRAFISESIQLKPLERRIIPTGIFIALPYGYEAQIRPRSGLSIKHGITVANTPGTIDSDYRGEICVALVNLSNKVYTIQDGDRIAQMIIARYESVNWQVVSNLEPTERADSGLGSTGLH